MSKPLLVIGESGQLARGFKMLCPDAIFLSRPQADLSLPQTLAATLGRYDAKAIINTAAYTQVDKAETEEKLATRINAESPAVMAEFCAERKIPFVHFSTDYVFSGNGEKPWSVDDIPAPLNAYGRSKLAGEKQITLTGGQTLIFRTSWLYDAAGKNFVNTILRLAAEREELRIIDDQYGAPTFATHLAAGALAALDHAMKQTLFPTGIYHLCNGGFTTWHGFASAILQHARDAGLPVKTRHIVPIPAREYPLPAARPYNSRLDCGRALSMFGVSLPSWQQGLKECMAHKA